MFKKILKVLAWLFGALVLIIGGISVWIGASDVPRYETKSIAAQRYTDSAHLEIGRRIVTERCAYCHLGDDSKLSGRQYLPADNPFGEFWTKNITQSMEHGIGKYSDGELAYLLRTGIRRDGLFAGPFMSSLTLSDEDLNCIISFLRSPAPIVQASEAQPKEWKANFLAKALMKFGVYAPLPYDGVARASVSPANEVEYGKYLVQSRYECYACHSQSFETLDAVKPENSPGYMGGGNEILGKDFKITKSANITPSKTNGIGSWTFEQFASTLRTGTNPSNRNLSLAMPRMNSLDSQEIRSIWKYMLTVPTLENHVQTN